jgi:hypothetical protein
MPKGVAKERIWFKRSAGINGILPTCGGPCHLFRCPRLSQSPSLARESLAFGPESLPRSEPRTVASDPKALEGELLPNSGQQLIKTLQQKSVKTPVDKSSFIEVRGYFRRTPPGVNLCNVPGSRHKALS